MSCFNRFYRKEKVLSKTLEIDEKLYNELENLSQNVYDASITKLVNAAIEDLISKEKVILYDVKMNFYITRSFLIKDSFWEGLYKLKCKYGLSIRILVNTAIRNVLIEEGIIEENKKEIYS